MSGHVFHPGHQELHGITVVVETSQDQLYVGRFDRQDETGVHLMAVSIFDPSVADHSRADFLARTARFGVKVDRSHMVVPANLVREITRLSVFATS